MTLSPGQPDTDAMTGHGRRAAFQALRRTIAPRFVREGQ